MNYDDNDNVNLVQDTLVELIDQGRKHLRSFGDIVEETEGDPKVLKSWVETAHTLGDLTQKLLNIEKLKLASQYKNQLTNPIHGQIPNQTQNNLFITKPSDFLREFEKVTKGKKTLQDVNEVVEVEPKKKDEEQ